MRVKIGRSMTKSLLSDILKYYGSAAFSWLGFLAERIWKGLFGKIWIPHIFSNAECFTWGKNTAKEKYDNIHLHWQLKFFRFQERMALLYQNILTGNSMTYADFCWRAAVTLFLSSISFFKQGHPLSSSNNSTCCWTPPWPSPHPHSLLLQEHFWSSYFALQRHRWLQNFINSKATVSREGSCKQNVWHS